MNKVCAPAARQADLLADLIAHNADAIRREQHRSRLDAEYLALCMLIDDLSSRPDTDAAYQAVIALLQTDYHEHFSDIVTYVGWSTGQLRLKPEVERALRKRHRS